MKLPGMTLGVGGTDSLRGGSTSTGRGAHGPTNAAATTNPPGTQAAHKGKQPEVRDKQHSGCN